MKRIFKGIQLLVAIALMGQYVPTTVQAVEIMVENSQEQVATPLFTFKAEEDPKAFEQLSIFLKEFEDKEYVVQQPVKLMSYEENSVREDAYYPIVVNRQLKSLIRHNKRDNKYVLEKKEIVEQIKSYKLSLTNKNSVVFLEVADQILGKSNDGITNFTKPAMSPEENQQLMVKVESVPLELNQSYDMYDENAKFQANAPTNVTEKKETEVTNEQSANPQFSQDSATKTIISDNNNYDTTEQLDSIATKLSKLNLDFAHRKKIPGIQIIWKD